MRFAAVPLPEPEPKRSPAAEFVRRLVAAEKLPRANTEASPAEPPVDLDQRVRLIGEW
ncbi:MAG TPA: hypothetical protein VL593_18250 [Ramlibacter sp.]|jgi:hypothetical protein|nr:hypothetical protein [Ramlibacter sp.]